MLGSTQPNAFSPQLTSLGGITAGVGIGTHAEVAYTDCVSPAQDRKKLFGRSSRCRQHCTNNNIAASSVDRDDVPFSHDDLANRERTVGDLDRVRTDNGRRTPTARDHCSVADKPAFRRQKTCGDHHAVHICWRRLIADQDHCFATVSCVCGIVRGEVDLADRRPR